MNSLQRDRLLKEKRLYELLGIKLMDNKDRQVTRYVNDMISGIKTGAIICREPVLFSDVVIKSIGNLRIFGDAHLTKAISFGFYNYLKAYKGSTSFSTHVTYNVDDRTLKPDKNSGKVEHFKVCEYFDRNSDVFLTHEFIHALKETNYNEYVLVTTLSDVIPIFYELLEAKNDVTRQRDILNARLVILKTEGKTFIDVSREMKKSKNDKDLYKIVQCRTGQYLNSFYYAMILYNIYRENPKLVLDYVRKVLSHEMTTKEMLENLGILHSDKTNVFEEELDVIRKVLK